MLNIRVKRELILDKLATNMVAHVKTFNETMENYRVAAIAWYSQQLAVAKEGGKFSTYASTLQRVPKTHVESYERAIGLLKMGTEDTVALTESDYAKYIQDDWDWKEEFRGISASYSYAHSA